ncbi:MAG: hypothetical protein K2Q19_12230, partial [Rhodocyclaceae bacterium]|nr:hypothetical protein [Rhodocyclaceae bacterium]
RTSSVNLMAGRKSRASAGLRDFLQNCLIGPENIVMDAAANIPLADSFILFSASSHGRLRGVTGQVGTVRICQGDGFLVTQTYRLINNTNQKTPPE